MYNEFMKNIIDNTFDGIGISIASPNKVKSWSYGEIVNPETINYRSFRPEKGGLFCEKIFGPTKDWECGCGKYKRIKYKGIICDRCGVEVTTSKVRRERLGHIKLAVPVSHIWFLKSVPSKIGTLLNISIKNLEKIIYYEKWIVIDPKETGLDFGQILSDFEYRELCQHNDFKVDIGASAISELLKKINLQREKEKITNKVANTKNKIILEKYMKNLRLIDGFINNEMKPEWMILEILPIIPPDLRPLVPLDGGRFATYDLNDLYRRIIYRNNRLKNLLNIKAPSIIIRNEKRMLQESIDALLDNGRHGKVVTSANKRPFKSISDMLKGKTGRFRQNLLGKRVDYSGRSVIVVGPDLKLSQCGLPKKMALTLFEPFIIKQLKERGYAYTIRNAKKMIEKEDEIVWDILEKIIHGHPILLNRAPSLHRLSIQAFDPVLIEGSAIRINPLVCAAYNADFDGDQMAVHVPLSNIAQIETKLLMPSVKNIFSPSNGKPITTPTQDIVLGIYYLTTSVIKSISKKYVYKKYFGYFELLHAYFLNKVKIHDFIQIFNVDYKKNTVWGDKTKKYIITTVGRCIFNEIWPNKLGFYNKVVNGNCLNDMIRDCYRYVDHKSTVEILDKLKMLGYEYATKSGFSISITDLKIPNNKFIEIEKSKKLVKGIYKKYLLGKVTEDERVNSIIDIWNKTSNIVADELIITLKETFKNEEINSLFAMLDSGSRGSKDQIRQLAAMRGLMAKPGGEIIESPILSNFREGLSVAEYFISTHGARKGLADTALKTAESGYMTRKLVDVAQDIICTKEDCHTTDGIKVIPLKDSEKEIIPIKDRIFGRYCAKDVVSTVVKNGKSKKTIIIKSGEYITEDIAKTIENFNIKEVYIRSPLTCKCEFGICANCYGKNLAVNNFAKVGDALGIIAAQSIGEPGTQLTMRTFHIGGTASSILQQNSIRAEFNGKIIFSNNIKFIKKEKNSQIVIREGKVTIINKNENIEYILIVGAIVYFSQNDIVKKDDLIAKWDPFNIPIISESSGKIKFEDLKIGSTLQVKIIEEKENIKEYLVVESKEELYPKIMIFNNKIEVEHYYTPPGTVILVEENEIVNCGKIIAKLPQNLTKNKDIIGGLPKITELFEARRIKDTAEIAIIDGIVEIGEIEKSKICLTIRDKNDSNLFKTLLIPINKYILVKNNDEVRQGQKLTNGSISLQDLLFICGEYALQRHIIDEVQLVYKLQGVSINDKHIEIIVRQMLKKIKIIDPGDTKFLQGEHIDKYIFNKENEIIKNISKIPAISIPILLGITKASLETDSFLSASSFQDTTRILTDAAVLGKVDYLRGFKENVIIGHLIPTGTGSEKYKNLKLKKKILDKELNFNNTSSDIDLNDILNN